MKISDKGHQFEVTAYFVGILLLILEMERSLQLLENEVIKDLRDQLTAISVIVLGLFFVYKIRQLRRTIKKENFQRTQLEESFQNSNRQEAIRMKEQMYNSLFQENQVSILLWNSVTLDIIDANPAACQFYGWTHDELINKKISDINTFTYQEIYQEMEQALHDGCNHFHFKHRVSSGEVRNVEVYSGTISNTADNLVYSLIFDVTDRDKFREQLYEIQHRNEALLKANPDVMIILNKEGIILDYLSGENSPFPAVPVTHLGKKYSEVFPENLTQLIYSNLEQLFFTGTNQSFNYQWKLEDEIKYSIARLVLIDPEKALLIGSDISKLQQANERVKLQAYAMDAAMEGLAIHDENGLFIYLNKAHARMHGYEISELIGKPWQILFDSDQLDRLTKEVRSILNTQGICTRRVVAKKKDGTSFSQQISLTRLEEGYTICTVHDISERLQAEQELIDAKIKAEESDRLKTAFLANMSHEIRTPMNGIIGFAGLLKEPKLSEEAKEEYLNIITKSGERLLHIINDIVEISKIEAGMVEMKIIQTNINEQLEYVGKFFKPEAEKKGIQLKVIRELPAENSSTLTDKEKLYAVLINLVKNAIKYCHDGVIEIGCRKEGQFLEFMVKDTGIGIPEDLQHSIFDRFTQVDLGNKRNYEGNGLGLSISKAYIEILGGKIWLKSKLGEGSAFYFTLPYMPEKAKPAVVKIPKRLHPHLNGLTALIVEDETISRQLLSKLLEPFCSHLFYADNGVDAIRICQNVTELDLILMDIQLPKMDGYTATRQIREFNKQVVIIAQTALALAHNREEALQAGCDDYIPKPIRRDVLEQLLLKYLGDRKKVPEAGPVTN